MARRIGLNLEGKIFLTLAFGGCVISLCNSRRRPTYFEAVEIVPPSMPDLDTAKPEAAFTDSKITVKAEPINMLHDYADVLITEVEGLCLHLLNMSGPAPRRADIFWKAARRNIDRLSVLVAFKDLKEAITRLDNLGLDQIRYCTPVMIRTCHALYTKSDRLLVILAKAGRPVSPLLATMTKGSSAGMNWQNVHGVYMLSESLNDCAEVYNWKRHSHPAPRPTSAFIAKLISRKPQP